MVPSAYLRVFQSLERFERDEQLHWERYLVQRSAGSIARPRYADRVTGEGLGMLAPAGREEAEGQRAPDAADPVNRHCANRIVDPQVLEEFSTAYHDDSCDPAQNNGTGWADPIARARNRH